VDLVRDQDQVLEVGLALEVVQGAVLVRDRDLEVVRDRALEVVQGLVQEVDLAQVRDQDQGAVQDQVLVTDLALEADQDLEVAQAQELVEVQAEAQVETPEALELEPAQALGRVLLPPLHQRVNQYMAKITKNAVRALTKKKETVSAAALTMNVARQLRKGRQFVVLRQCARR